MPHRWYLGLGIVACSLLSADIRPLQAQSSPGNTRRTISDEPAPPSSRRSASAYQLPSFQAPPDAETPAPSAEEPTTEPIPVDYPQPVTPTPVLREMPPAPPAPRPILAPPPASASPLPPLVPPPGMTIDHAVQPAAHMPPLPAAAKEFTAKAETPLPLAPRNVEAAKSLERPGLAGATPSLVSIAGSLGAVLGLFLLFVWCTRRALPKGMARLPNEALEMLGRLPVQGKQEFQLVRVGNKIVLLAVSPMGMESVAEITDPDEVERLCALCTRSQPGSITETFREVLGQLGTEPARGGFAGEFARAAPKERGGR